MVPLFKKTRITTKRKTTKRRTTKRKITKQQTRDFRKLSLVKENLTVITHHLPHMTNKKSKSSKLRLKIKEKNKN